MKAIVLTFDNNRFLTEHMILKYEQLWPDNPFLFLIPFQKLSFQETKKRQYIKSPTAIKATVLRLLKDLDDEEWIYWCIDDKYPINLNLKPIQQVFTWVQKNPAKIDGISFTRLAEWLEKEYVEASTININESISLLERNGYERIWMHQFLKVKVIKYIFEQLPDNFGAAKRMDTLIKSIQKPQNHRLFVTKKNFAIYGESASRGMLTKNCYQSLVKENVFIPLKRNNHNGRKQILGQNNWRILISQLLGNGKIKGVYRFITGFKQFADLMGGSMDGQKIKQRVAITIIKKCKPSFIVETGTLYGTTTKWLTSHSNCPIYSCEINDANYTFSTLRFFINKRVKISNQNSIDFLSDLSQNHSLTKTTFFYLDAHSLRSTPIKEEVKIIFENWKKAIILINNFQVPNNKKFGYKQFDKYTAIKLNYFGNLFKNKHLFFPLDYLKETGAKKGYLVVTNDERQGEYIESLDSLSRFKLQ